MPPTLVASAAPTFVLRLEGNAPMRFAIGATGAAISTAIHEISLERIADRPTAETFPKLHDRDPSGNRDHDILANRGNLDDILNHFDHGEIAAH